MDPNFESDDGAGGKEVVIDLNTIEAPYEPSDSFSSSELTEDWSEESPMKRPRQDLEDPLEVLHSRQPTPSEKDEFDTFGKYIALALKNMPIHLALQCQNELQTTLTRFRFMSIGGFESSQDSLQGPVTQDPTIKSEPLEEVLLMDDAMFS